MGFIKEICKEKEDKIRKTIITVSLNLLKFLVLQYHVIGHDLYEVGYSVSLKPVRYLTGLVHRNTRTMRLRCAGSGVLT